MKQTALILLGIMLVAVFVFGLLVATLPRANVTIRAVGPTGDFVTRTNELGKEVRYPLWQFAITNTGRANADWGAYSHVREPKRSERQASTPLDDMIFGSSPPGSGVVTNIAVPPQDNSIWSGTISYWSTPSRLERNLWPVGRRVPWLGDLFPNKRPHFSFDVWHTNTNVAPTSALPQKGTNP
jgi:hypothetical protein